MLLTRSDPPCRRVVCGRDAERLRERLEESAREVRLTRTRELLLFLFAAAA